MKKEKNLWFKINSSVLILIQYTKVFLNLYVYLYLSFFFLLELLGLEEKKFVNYNDNIQ